MQISPQDPIARAACSLEGLSFGDAFGETFFINPDVVEGLIAERALAARTWTYTDDTLAPSRSEFLDLVLPDIPESEVRSKLRQARDMLPNASVEFAVSVLGMARECLRRTQFLSPCGVRLSVSRIMKRRYGSL